MAVDTVSDEVQAMRTASQRIRDICEGGPHMRRAGEIYLPKFPMETKEAYDARKQGSWLFDGVGKAIEDYVGRLFDKPINCADEGELGQWCENIDFEGRDLSNFAQDVFESGVKDGVSFIMVDAPRRPEGVVTRGQAVAKNLRPYMVHVPITSALGWKVDNSGPSPVVTMFRIMESVLVEGEDEFTEKRIDQVRVLSLTEGRVSVTLYRQKEGEADWYIHDEYLTDLEEITVAPFYTGRTGFLTAKPPLDRLAEINLAHWRSQSDQSNIMHHSRVPLTAFMGWDKDELTSMLKAPGYGLATSNPDAKVETVEHGGTALGAGREELKDLEQQMQYVGLQLVMSRTNGATATGDMIDEKKNTSALSRWADNLKDALEIALSWMADIGGISGADTDVQMSKDFVAIHLDGVAVDQMIKLGLPPKYIIKEMQRRGSLSEDLDPEEIADEIDEVMDAPDQTGIPEPSGDNVVDFAQGLTEALNGGR